MSPLPPGDGERRVLVLAHTGRPTAVEAAEEVIDLLQAAGVHPITLPEQAAALSAGARSMVMVAEQAAEVLEHIELVVVLGGDGTILRAAETVRASAAPLLGVNLGHVGFLAEAESDDLAETVLRIVERGYEVEERMCIDIRVECNGRLLGSTWALNEASVEKVTREKMIEVVLEVDDRPVTEFGCDGVVLATPTGSTAYAFSAGGPVVWPELEALLMVPISAHALFARPLVAAPTSLLAVEVISPTGAVVWCDGRRSIDVPEGGRVEVRRSADPVRLARLARPPFTDRLVAKFQLPVHGWRGHPRRPLRRADHTGPDTLSLPSRNDV